MAVLHQPQPTLTSTLEVPNTSSEQDHKSEAASEGKHRMPNRMLQTLKLGGYRRFESFELTHLRPVNLLVGMNGCGKTSILEAVELLVSGGGSSAALLAPLLRRQEINEAASSYYVNICHLYYDHRCSPGTQFEISAQGSHLALHARILTLDNCGEIVRRWEARASRHLDVNSLSDPEVALGLSLTHDREQAAILPISENGWALFRTQEYSGLVQNGNKAVSFLEFEPASMQL